MEDSFSLYLHNIFSLNNKNNFIMKTLRLFGLLLFSMIAFFVASCGGDSSDDSGSGGGSGNLTPPKYESSNALYNYIASIN